MIACGCHMSCCLQEVEHFLKHAPEEGLMVDEQLQELVDHAPEEALKSVHQMRHKKVSAKGALKHARLL